MPFSYLKILLEVLGSTLKITISQKKSCLKKTLGQVLIILRHSNSFFNSFYLIILFKIDTLIQERNTINDTSIEGTNTFLLSSEILEENISNNVPWHVNCTCAIVVNLGMLKSRQDITIDSWTWTLSKSYVVSGEKYGPFVKYNE